MTQVPGRITDRFSHRTAARHGEVRLPASLAIVAAAAIYAVLPHDLLFGPRWLIPAVELVLLVTLIVINPTQAHDRDAAVADGEPGARHGDHRDEHGVARAS